jgi:uncharacterized membrane protein
MDMVGRVILRFLLVPLGALVAVLAVVATLIIAHWSTMLALASFYQRQQGDVLAGPLLLFGIGFYATFMMAPAAIGALVAEAFAIRSWIYHALNGGLSAWVGWSATSDMRDEYAFLNDPKIVVAAGIAAGFSYWLVAGWNAGFWKPLFRRTTQLAPVTKQ